MRRITASCCQSFSPNSARSGRTCANSLATTVATPSKWPGREAPHSPSPSPATETVVAKPVGIDLLDRRRPQQVDALGLEQPRILGQLARIGGEVLVGAELASG